VGLLAAAVAATFASVSCDKMPLLAPTGTTISLFASSSVLAPNGSMDVIATLIEQGTSSTGGTTTTTTGGQPVHNGTVVTFTTTIGTIAPSEARTHNGQVTVKFTGDGRSGVASVFAYSGGAKSAELKINIGTAAVDRVILTADPQTLPPSGGTTQLSARVEDVAGTPLSGIDVAFSTTTGTLTSPSVKTDSNGVAATSLTTSQAAKITATCGAKTGTVDIVLSPRTGIAITPPSSAPNAATPASFTVSVTGTTNIRDVTITWGDGTSTALGAIAGSTTITHTYSREGTYTVTATATDTLGNRESVSTSVTVLQAPTVAVTVTASPATPQVNQVVTFTATATPGTGAAVTSYDWSFGDGTGTTTSGGSASKVYTTSGTMTVTVTARTNLGTSGTGQTIVTVTPQVPISVTLAASSTQPVTNQTVTFTATTGTLPAGTVILRYEWDFGDGATIPDGTSNTATHAYSSAGTKDIKVKVVLSNGGFGTGNITIVVTNPNPVTVALSAVPNTATRAVTIVKFTASVGALPPGVSIVEYQWNFGDGIGTATTTNNTYDYQYPAAATAGTKTVTVTVVLSNGTTAVGQALVTVS
jgi:PKD repeat protein